MKLQRYKIYSCLFLIAVSSIGLYTTKVEDYSFLKEASGSDTCYFTCTDMWNCGNMVFGVENCGPFILPHGPCHPDFLGCSRRCPEGAINQWCANTTPDGGDCEVDFVSCTTLTYYTCLPMECCKECMCCPNVTQGICARQIC